MADKPTKEQRRRWAAKRRQDAVANSGAVGVSLPRSGAKTTSTSSGRTVPGSPVGGNVYDPNSYLPTPALGNPSLPIWAQPRHDTEPDFDAAKPLPQGRGFDPGYVNDLNATRMQQNAEFRNNPTAYAEANDRALNTEESLLDKGMSMLGRLFNYEDEADLNLFGIPLAPVESAWDRAMRHFTGAYDLLSVGMGGLLSAAPGGVPTLSYDELSAGRSVGEILNGEIGLMDNAAPTPGQIFVASIAAEAKRIREGGARASDILLANPATGPFILAALAADTSPLQKDGFDIRDPEKRKEAFGSGFEQWGSGAFDFGIQFADPAIAAGVGLKIARVGMLGAKSPIKYAQMIGKANKDAYNEIAAIKGWHSWDDVSLVNGFRRTDGTKKYERFSTRVLADEAVRRTAADVYDVSVPVARERERLVSVDPDINAERPLLDVSDEFWDDPMSGGLGMRDTYRDGDLTLEQVQELTDRVEAWSRGKVDMSTPTVIERIYATNPTNPADNNEFWDDLSDMFSEDDRFYYQRLRDEGVDEIDPPDMGTPEFDTYARDMEHVEIVEDIYDRWLLRKAGPEFEDMSTYPGGGLIDSSFNRRTLNEGDINPDDLQTPLGKIVARLSMRGPDGKPKMSVKEIMQMPEIRNLPAKAAVSKMLYSINDPYEMALVISSLSGDPGAVKALQRWAPSLGDDVYAFWHEQVAAARRLMEPDMIAEARGMMDASISNLTDQISEFQRQAIDAPDSARQHLQTRVDRLQKSIDQFNALKEVLDGKRLDPLVPTQPYYDPQTAMRILRDMYRRQDIVQTATRAEVKNAFAMMDMDRRFPVRANWYSRMVTDSRFRRARAAYEYSEEGGNLIPKRVLVKTTIGDSLDPDDARKTITPEYDWQGWLAPSRFEGTSRFQRGARVWRWFGTQTPAGYIGLKGTSAMGSENELMAVIGGIDIYKGDPVEVIVKNADGTLAEPEPIGGSKAAEDMLNLFTEALRDPAKDPLDAIMQIEEQIARDMSAVYGYDADNLSSAIAKANGFRKTTIEEIQRHGFFVDPDDGDIHHVPWLRTNLANGTYMHNWGDLERSLQRWAKGQYGSEFAQRGRMATQKFTDIAVEADTMFQNFWRPATLLRLSYTQRNVFEGMLRAMAFYSSVAPLSWPVKATAYGIESKVRKAAVKRSADAAGKKIAASGVRSVMGDYDAAKMNLAALLSAQRDVDEAGAVFYRVSRRHLSDDQQYEIVSEKEMMERVLASREEVAGATEALKASEAQFDALVKGTKFGTWRRKNLEDIAKQRAEYQSRVDQINELLNEAKTNVDPPTWQAMNNQATDVIASFLAQVAGLERKESMLRYSPMDGISMYRSKAGRARRIGSGTSVGPDGNRYNDAWNDSFENINRGQMSADLTTRQTLSAESDFKGNIFSAILLRENEPIPYTPATQDEWVHGMVDVITRNSFNPLVGRLFAVDFDPKRVVDWLLETPQGQQEMLKLQMLMGDYMDPAYKTKRNDPIKAAAYTQKEAEPGKPKPDPRIARSYQPGTVDSSGRVMGIKGPDDLIDVYDLSRLEAYVTDVANTLRMQMQDNPAFFALQERAARATLTRSSGMRTVAGDPEPITAADVWDVLNNQLTPDERAKLGYVQGSRLIEMGTPKITEIWSKYVNKMFRAIGTIPEDAVVRGPFYAKRFKQVRNSLIELYWQQQGKTPAEVKRQLKAMRTQEGRTLEGTLAHDQFEIPAGELSDIYVSAHYQALRDTRDWMYTIERRTNLGKYGEFIFPFISASQNSATVGGRLLWKNPWILPIGIDLWRAPTRLGWEDEEGNLKMPMPFEWVKQTLADNPWIPVLGGAVGADDMITIPKDGLNVFMPDTGFGVVPRPGVFVQVGASELMKAGAFPVEPPGILKAAMGEEDALQTWTMLKDYVFGSQDTMSTKFLSWDKAAPAWVKRIIESKDEMSNQYGYLYSMNWASENQRYYAGLRDTAPTEQEIHERTTNGFWFMALGNVGVPTPLTPYPILTRPDVNKVQIQFLQERWQAYQKTYPQDAAMNFMEDYGDLMLPLAQTKVSKNVGGAAAGVEAVSDIKTLDPVIRDITPLLGDDGLEMLDMVVNNRATLTDYDESAYQWERTATIGGTSRKWRESQSPEEAEQERNRLAGWTEYQAFMDGLDARLYSAGLTNYEQAGAIQFKLSKERFLLNMADRDDRKQWYLDYIDTGGARTQKAVMVLEKSVSNDVFRKHMVTAGKEATLAAMDEYVYYRRSIVQAVRESGKSLSAEENSDLKAAWLNIRQRLTNGDERFATIMNRWLAGDDDPTFPGNYLDTGGTDG